MAIDLADQYRRWFDYEHDAHGKVLASLESVPIEARESAGFRRALTLLGHMAAARRAWLARLGAIPTGPATLFPEDLEIAAAADAWREIHGPWREFLAKLDDATLATEIKYRTSEGDWYQDRVDDILAHLFGHSFYHRGQIAMLVRAAGGTPAKSDLIYWSRDPIADPNVS